MTDFKPFASSLLSRRTLLKLALGTSAAAVGCGLTKNTMSDNRQKPTSETFTVAPVEARPIPSTGERLPVVGVGTWQTFDVGTGAERGPLADVLELLVKAKGSVVDSSPMYGRSEAVVGDLTTASNLRKSLFLATKVWTSGENEGIAQMRESMKLLQTDRLDLMQIHNLVDWKTHLKTLRGWKDQGKIRYLGITHYTVGAYPDLERILQTEKIDFVQFNYSIRTREAENRLLPLAREKGVAVLVNRPFEEGALFRAVQGKPLPDWAAEIGAKSWGQFFLKYILGEPSVTCVLTGTSKARHLADNLGAGSGPIPDDKTRRRMAEHLQRQ